LLHRLGGGDVGALDDEELGIAGLVAHERAADLHPHHRPVAAHEPPLHVGGADLAGQQRVAHRAAGEVGRMHERLQAVSHELDAAVAEHLHERPVHLQPVAVERHDSEAARGEPEQGTEAIMRGHQPSIDISVQLVKSSTDGRLSASPPDRRGELLTFVWAATAAG
jgi:hypothetical protein